MKKFGLFLLVTLFGSRGFPQLKTITKDLNVTNSLQLSLNKVNAISKDTSSVKRDNYLITEKAAKDYADSRSGGRPGLTYNYDSTKYLVTKSGLVIDSVALPAFKIDSTLILRGDILGVRGGGGGFSLLPTTGTGTATGNVTGAIGNNNFNLLTSDGSKFSFLPADKAIQLSVGPATVGLGDTYIRLRGNDANNANNSIVFVVDGNGNNKSMIFDKNYGLGINARTVIGGDFLLNDGNEGTEGYVMTTVGVDGRGTWKPRYNGTSISGEEHFGFDYTNQIDLLHDVIIGTLRVFKNGIRLPAYQYTLSTSTVIFTVEPLETDLFIFDYNY